MRYSKTENAILVGTFGVTGLGVTMKMIVLETDNLVELKAATCVESAHMPGVYLFSTANIKEDSIDKDCNILAEMTGVINGKETKRYGKISFGGVVDSSEVTDLSAIKTKLVTMSETLDLVLAEVS